MTQKWQEIARTLPIGSKRKVVCCGTDPSSYISNSHKGISLGPCFRCNAKDWEPHGERSIEQILAARREEDKLVASGTPTMPPDAVPLADGPPEAILWVLRGGLPPETATETYGMRWHEKTRRVLIPIPGGLLGRAVFGERPKYRMLGKPGVLYWPQKRPHSPVTVVEDILSAIAIDRAGGAAVAVLGTSISPSQAAEIAADRTEVIGWFDGDAAGDKAFNRLRKKLALFPINLTRIRTDTDPKTLHRSVIRDLIQSKGT